MLLENKVPDHSKYITTSEFNKLKESFTVRLKQTSFATKCDIADFVKNAGLDEKLKN